MRYAAGQRACPDHRDPGRLGERGRLGQHPLLDDPGAGDQVSSDAQMLPDGNILLVDYARPGRF